MAIGSAGTLEQADYVTFLKEWYQGSVVADLCYKNHPWFGMVPKNPNVRGNVYVKPVRYANIAGQSALYADAHANQAPAQRERWEMTHVDNYAKATVSNKVMELSLGDPAAFREALTDAVDSAYNAFANDVHFELLAKYSDGARTQLPTQTTGGLVMDLNPGDARFFEKGMVLQHAVSPYSALADSAEKEVVDKVDRINDKITLVADWTTGFAAGDRIYRSGDFGIKADSLPTWLPGSGVGTDLYNGINRTADPTRLAGIDGVKGTTSGYLYTEAMIKTGARLYKEGSSPDIALLNPIDYASFAFEIEQTGARHVKTSSTEGNVSFSAIEIMTGSGAVPVVADPALAEDSMLMGERSAVELFSAGGLPRMFKKDGSFYHREETADTLAFYLFGFYNQSLQAPVKWAYTSDVV